MVKMKPNVDDSLIAKANKFVETKFAAVNIIPTHSIEVGNILQNEMDADSELIAAGILHDTLEDTNTSVEELTAEFSSAIAKLVCEVSHKKNPTHGDRISYYDQLKTASPQAKMIKLADILSHMRAFGRIYEANEQHEHPKFKNNHLYIAQIRSFIESVPNDVPVKYLVIDAVDRLESLHKNISW